jgi:hypothetical protein
LVDFSFSCRNLYYLFDVSANLSATLPSLSATYPNHALFLLKARRQPGSGNKKRKNTRKILVLLGYYLISCRFLEPVHDGVPDACIRKYLTINDINPALVKTP